MAKKNKLKARQKAWEEAKPRMDVDNKTVLLPDTNTAFHRPGSENPNK